MALLWTAKADYWMVKPAFFSAVAGKTGFHGRFRMGIYSPRTGFLGNVALNEALRDWAQTFRSTLQTVGLPLTCRGVFLPSTCTARRAP